MRFKEINRFGRPAWRFDQGDFQVWAMKESDTQLLVVIKDGLDDVASTMVRSLDEAEEFAEGFLYE